MDARSFWRGGARRYAFLVGPTVGDYFPVRHSAEPCGERHGLWTKASHATRRIGLKRVLTHLGDDPHNHPSLRRHIHIRGLSWGPSNRARTTGLGYSRDQQFSEGCAVGSGEVYESIHKAVQYQNIGATQIAGNMNESDGITMDLNVDS
jgi:hypothetical protein